MKKKRSIRTFKKRKLGKTRRAKKKHISRISSSNSNVCSSNRELTDILLKEEPFEYNNFFHVGDKKASQNNTPQQIFNQLEGWNISLGRLNKGRQVANKKRYRDNKAFFTGKILKRKTFGNIERRTKFKFNSKRRPWDDFVEEEDREYSSPPIMTKFKTLVQRSSLKEELSMFDDRASLDLLSHLKSEQDFNDSSTTNYKNNILKRSKIMNNIDKIENDNVLVGAISLVKKEFIEKQNSLKGQNKKNMYASSIGFYQKMEVEIPKKTNRKIFNSRTILKDVNSTKYSGIKLASSQSKFRINRISSSKLEKSKSSDSKAIYNLRQILFSKDEKVNLLFNKDKKNNYAFISKSPRFLKKPKKEIDLKLRLFKIKSKHKNNDDYKYQDFVRNIENKLKRVKSEKVRKVHEKKKRLNSRNHFVKSLKKCQQLISKNVAYFNLIDKKQKKKTKETKIDYNRIFQLDDSDEGKSLNSRLNRQKEKQKKMHKIFQKVRENNGEESSYVANSSINIAQNCLKILHDNRKIINSGDAFGFKAKKLNIKKSS